jgi:hypothetical protein
MLDDKADKIVGKMTIIALRHEFALILGRGSERSDI